MSRKILKKKFLFISDYKFHNYLINIIINKIIKSGKKNLAKKIIFKTLNYIKLITKKNPIYILECAIRNCSPKIKIITTYTNGSTQNAPVLLNKYKSTILALNWIIEFCKQQKGKYFYLKLALEILNTYKGIGTTIKKKEEIHKAAIAHKSSYYSN